jgi:hypothetical protein
MDTCHAGIRVAPVVYTYERVIAEGIPKEIYISIFKHLSMFAAGNLSLVSKHWHSMTLDESLWSVWNSQIINAALKDAEKEFPEIHDVMLCTEPSEKCEGSPTLRDSIVSKIAKNAFTLKSRFLEGLKNAPKACFYVHVFKPIDESPYFFSVLTTPLIEELGRVSHLPLCVKVDLLAPKILHVANAKREMAVDKGRGPPTMEMYRTHPIGYQLSWRLPVGSYCHSELKGEIEGSIKIACQQYSRLIQEEIWADETPSLRETERYSFFYNLRESLWSFQDRVNEWLNS